MMNQNFIILLFVVIIIGVGLYYNTNSKKEKDPGNTPTFEVVGISVSKTENYKPWFTERYTNDEYIAMSKGTVFTYTLKITNGAQILTELSITRKGPQHDEFGVPSRSDTKDIPSADWVNNKDIIVEFPSLENENIKGKHQFSINYTIPGTSKTGVASVEVEVTNEDLSVGIENGVVNLNFTESALSSEAGFKTLKEFVNIIDSDGTVNFGSTGDVYFSPVDGTDGKGFTIQGIGVTYDTLYKYKYGDLMYFSTSPNANFKDEDVWFMDKNKDLVQYSEGVFNDIGFTVERVPSVESYTDNGRGSCKSGQLVSSGAFALLKPGEPRTADNNIPDGNLFKKYLKRGQLKCDENPACTHVSVWPDAGYRLYNSSDCSDAANRWTYESNWTSMKVK